MGNCQIRFELIQIKVHQQQMIDDFNEFMKSVSRQTEKNTVNE